MLAVPVGRVSWLCSPERPAGQIQQVAPTEEPGQPIYLRQTGWADTGAVARPTDLVPSAVFYGVREYIVVQSTCTCPAAVFAGAPTPIADSNCRT